MIHSSDDVEASNARWIVGSATLTSVLLTPSMKKAIETASRVSHLARCPPGAAISCVSVAGGVMSLSSGHDGWMMEVAGFQPEFLQAGSPPPPSIYRTTSRL